MTKVREPMTFEDAVTRIAGRIGWAAAADAVGKVERVVRNWSDPDMDRRPTLEEALALDAAYLRAGGGEPPLMAVYAARLEVHSQPTPDAAELARVTGAAAREVGEAVAAMVAAAQPGAGHADRAIAQREITEGIEALTQGLRMLGAPTLN